MRQRKFEAVTSPVRSCPLTLPSGASPGSSSGIGKALAERLAQQGLSLVLVALDDELLSNTHAELTDKYPECRFIKVLACWMDAAASFAG